MNRRELEMSAACAAALFAMLALPKSAVAAIKPDEARAIAKEAYIYGYPLVESYRILHSYFVDRSSPEYKAAWNEKVANNARLLTPADVAMGSPNADTPYSHLGLDLRAEPMVLSVPAVAEGSLLLGGGERPVHVHRRLPRLTRDGQRGRRIS